MDRLAVLLVPAVDATDAAAAVSALKMSKSAVWSLVRDMDFISLEEERLYRDSITSHRSDSFNNLRRHDSILINLISIKKISSVCCLAVTLRDETCWLIHAAQAIQQSNSLPETKNTMISPSKFLLKSPIRTLSSKANSCITADSLYAAHNYSPLPVVLSRGLGCKVCALFIVLY